jgi:hypothetical protein
MLTCAICSDPYPWHRPCDQAHAGVCDACWRLNLSGNPLEAEAHPAPLEAVPALSAYITRMVGEVPAWPYTWLEED